MIKSNLAGNFLRDKNVASVFPTTKKTVSKICSSIDFEKNIIIVEYGPGTGIFTEYLLSKMNKDSKLIVIEKNKNLSFFLKNKFKDKRLRIFNDSAENIKDILKKEKIRGIDYIISGIPLSFLSSLQRDNLLKDTYNILKKGGKFLVYQFSRKSKSLITKHFDQIFSYLQIFNIPPLFVFEASKKSEKSKFSS